MADGVVVSGQRTCHSLSVCKMIDNVSVPNAVTGG